jgi:hypothetical protein
MDLIEFYFDSLVYRSIQQPTILALACEGLRDKRVFVFVPRERVRRNRLGLFGHGMVSFNSDTTRM